jgi:hypothetical protein
VKSFFGSRGVVADHVTGASSYETARSYALLNNEEVRDQVLAGACKLYGYQLDQIQMRLYVGRYAAPSKGENERLVRDWAAATIIGGGPVKVVALDEVVSRVRAAAARKEYRDNPVLVTLKVLEAAGQLSAPLPDDGQSS